MNTEWHGWQLFLMSTVPGVAAWLFAVLQWVLTRKDKKRTEGLTVNEKMQSDLTEQRKSLTIDQGLLFDRLRLEWTRSMQRVDELETEVARVWHLVRYWYRYCEALLHQLKNTRMLAENLAAKVEPPQTLGPFLLGEPLPDMEHPEDKP